MTIAHNNYPVKKYALSIITVHIIRVVFIGKVSEGDEIEWP